MTQTADSDDALRRAAKSYREYIPHVKALGMTVSDVQRGEDGLVEIVMDLPYDERLIGDPQHGFLSTGVMTTLVDSAAGLAVFCSQKQPQSIATLDLRMDYLRPARNREKLSARATCYRMTGKIAFVRADVIQDQQLLARSVSVFMMGTRGGRRSTKAEATQ